MPPKAPGVVASYHAHVYYPDGESRKKAAALREEIAQRFPVTLGRFRDAPVGPHPLPMYQVAFSAEVFAELVPWLMRNRKGLTVFLHPNTGDDLADHTDHAMWLGAKLELKTGMFEGKP